MYKKYIKVLVILPFLFLHIACGYEPLMTEKYQKYTIKNFNISGDKKLGQLLSNKFSKLEKGEHTISLNIKAQKNIEIANKREKNIIFLFFENFSSIFDKLFFLRESPE